LTCLTCKSRGIRSALFGDRRGMRLVRILALAFVVVLAACGSSGSKTKTTATTTASTTATTAAASGAAINTAQTGLGTVLVNAQGRTLYHRTNESATNIVCTGQCASTWPPVTVPSGQKPQAGAGVTGNLTVVNRPDGTQQAAINGQPLYMYSGDSKAGDTNGQGIGGIWFALTASGSSAGAGATGATTRTTAAHAATTSGGYGGGGY
jgi:predicted lipoprotein with Yx(FWY)xxD motif